jgi:hypothetical protein
MLIKLALLSHRVTFAAKNTLSVFVVEIHRRSGEGDANAATHGSEPMLANNADKAPKRQSINHPHVSHSPLGLVVADGTIHHNGFWKNHGLRSRWVMREGNCLRLLRRCRVIVRIGMISRAASKNAP